MPAGIYIPSTLATVVSSSGDWNGCCRRSTPWRLFFPAGRQAVARKRHLFWNESSRLQMQSTFSERTFFSPNPHCYPSKLRDGCRCRHNDAINDETMTTRWDAHLNMNNETALSQYILSPRLQTLDPWFSVTSSQLAVPSLSNLKKCHCQPGNWLTPL